MYKHIARGWFEVDGEMYESIMSFIKNAQGKLKPGWVVQDRQVKDILQPSFIHFGEYISKQDLKSFLELMTTISENVKSTLCDEINQITGEFLVSELNKEIPDLRIFIDDGTYEVKEC